MNKRLLAAGSIPILAVAVVAGAAAAKGKPSPDAQPVQRNLIVGIDKTTGLATASGYIKRGGRKVAVGRPSYVVTRSDSSGNACGSERTGSGSRLKLPTPGSFKVTVTLRSKQKFGGAYLAITKEASADLGADQLECAKLTSPPVAAAICAWGTTDPSQPCGVPISGKPAWLTPPQLEGGVVSAGTFASATTFCWRSTTPTTGVTWMGLAIQPMEWKCQDGETIGPFVYVWLTHPGSDQRCTDVGTPLGQVQSFQVPPGVGGTLYVSFALMFSGTRMELSNAVFELDGDEDGCAQLASHG